MYSYNVIYWLAIKTLTATDSNSEVYWLATCIKTLTAMDSYNEVGGTIGGGTGQYPAVWDLGQHL